MKVWGLEVHIAFPWLQRGPGAGENLMAWFSPPCSAVCMGRATLMLVLVPGLCHFYFKNQLKMVHAKPLLPPLQR